MVLSWQLSTSGILRKECWDGSYILEISLCSVARRMDWQGQGWCQEDHSWGVTIVIRREMMRPTQTITVLGTIGRGLEKYRGWWGWLQVREEGVLRMSSRLLKGWQAGMWYHVSGKGIQAKELLLWDRAGDGGGDDKLFQNLGFLWDHGVRT